MIVGMKLPMPEKMETSRTTLQRLRYEDAEEIFYVYASKPVATRYVSWPTHQTIRDTRAFLANAVAAWSAGTEYSYSIRLKESNRFIGTFGIVYVQGKVQFGYAFGPAHWGRGYATEVCIRMMGLLQAMPQVYRVGSFVDADNIASIRVLQKSGLLEEARLEKWFRFINQDNNPKDCILFRLPVKAIS